MDKVDQLINHYQATGLYTHVYAACGFLSKPEVLFETSLAPDGRTVFDLSSMTKAMVTTPLTLARCFARGLDPHEASLEKVFGKDSCDGYAKQLVNQPVAKFLRHETGLPAWRNFYVECEGKQQKLKEALARISLNNSRSDNKTKDLYSDLGFMILGECLERSTGKTLGNLWCDFSTQIGSPCSEEFGPSSKVSKDMTVPTAFCPVRNRDLLAEVHDENAWAMGGFTGHTGLFGSGRAVVRYLRNMWNDKVGKLVYEANFAEKNSPGDSLMGWRKGNDMSSSTFAESRGCGHLGFTGTAFWVDPKSFAYAVILTNRVISGRMPGTIKAMRAETFANLWEKLATSIK